MKDVGEHMKAAFICQTGTPDVIQYGDIETPSISGSEVLVKVGAVSLNPIDTYIRNGANYWELPSPFVLGCDVAGVVEAIGPNVTRFRVGDRVWGSNQGLLGRQGTFAEYCSIDQDWLYPSPDEVSDEALAACALVGITAHLGLCQNAKLQRGETLFVNGGSGGVGSMVIQMAKAMGAEVVATAGSDEKVQRCVDFGADLGINYRTSSPTDALLKEKPAGCQVYWETVREPDFDAIVEKLSDRGRVILMAGRDARPEFPVGPFYVKGCSIHGFVMFKATADEQRKSADDIASWLRQGLLKPNISHRFPLSEAAAAHQLQEENTLHLKGNLAGKIVLTPV